MADNPITRKEKYLAKLTGSYTGNVPDPITRVEKYLYDLCQKGISGLTPEEIENAVNKYLKENPVQPGATTEQAQQIEQNKTDIALLKKETGSLKEDLGDYTTLNLYLDVKDYAGASWNTRINKYIPSGTKIKFLLESYSGSLFSSARIMAFKSDETYDVLSPTIKAIGEEIEYTAKGDYVKINIQIIRSGKEDNVSAVVRLITDSQNGITKDIFKLGAKIEENSAKIEENKRRIYHVEKDGSGDFTRLVDAIEEAEKYMGSIVYVGNGTWDIIEELGNEYIENVSYSKRGVYLKNRIHLIFATDSKVTCHYTGDNATVKTWLSAFNAGKYGFTIENATIESSNCRYCVHDERGKDTDAYINKYINCNMTHDNTNGGMNQCIGGGLGTNGYIVIDGCTFENLRGLTGQNSVSYHNTAGSGKSHVEVKNCYFKGNYALRFSWYGNSTEKSTMLACGNSFGVAIKHVAETDTAPYRNTELIEWNNTIRS